ncbi:Mobile element protein [Methanosarcina siciliae C2J]|uniref:Mobile element protein n=1 Tax=Methanosarcina siciliae C2J TaxID=1434118 RepID=A0A0E3PPI5_9EURY|nr:Mobile element protein [Methanosarcina siciliae C2J]
MCESFRSHIYTQNVNTGKWKNYYIFPVIESPSYLKRIPSNFAGKTIPST